MERPEQKPTTKLKDAKKATRRGKQQEKAAPASKTKGTRYKCHPKKADADGIDLNTIDPNSPEADAQVLRSLLEMATSGKNTTATIFWAKARCGMNEKGRGKEWQVSQAPTIVIRTEEGKKA